MYDKSRQTMHIATYIRPYSHIYEVWQNYAESILGISRSFTQLSFQVFVVFSTEKCCTLKHVKNVAYFL